jgi:hypothetical protein
MLERRDDRVRVVCVAERLDVGKLAHWRVWPVCADLDVVSSLVPLKLYSPPGSRAPVVADLEADPPAALAIPHLGDARPRARSRRRAPRRAGAATRAAC